MSSIFTYSNVLIEYPFSLLQTFDFLRHESRIDCLCSGSDCSNTSPWRFRGRRRTVATVGHRLPLDGTKAGTSVAGNNTSVSVDYPDDDVPQSASKPGFSAFAALGTTDGPAEEEEEDFGGLMVCLSLFM